MGKSKNGKRRASTVRLTFLGAAQTVTGSRYLIETDGVKALIDCGLFQGRKKLRLRNWERPPFDPAEIDAVILTHAHIDHTGYLPRIVKEGYKGPIYCTRATRDLLHLLLPDTCRKRRRVTLTKRRAPGTIRQNRSLQRKMRAPL
jgi:metallo-beta-lactamase family protein